MPTASISRRSALFSLAAAASCGRRKATVYPGYALVAIADGNSVAVVELSRFRVRGHIALNGSPGHIVAHPARPAAFVAIPLTGEVVEVEPGALRPVRGARPGGVAVGMRLAPGGRSLWVLYREPGSLVELPLDTLRPAARIRLPGTPVDFDFRSDGLAAVCFRGASGVALADPKSGSVTRTIPNAAPVSLVRFRSDGKHILAAQGEARMIAILDVASGKTVVRLPLALVPRDFCFSPDGGQLFVAGEGADAVAIVFPYATEVAETILAGRAPGGMATAPNLPYLFVANPATGSITVFDIETRKLVAVVDVGREPRSIVITPDNQYALVLNQASGDVAVVRISSFGARRALTAPRPDPRRLFNLIPVGARPVGAVVVATA